MPEWLISIIGVVVGAILALGGKEVIDLCKRPILNVDFEERAGIKPYIEVLNEDSLKSPGIYSPTAFLRLCVHNKGKSTAHDCEAKIELFVPKRNEHYKNPLHWARQDPRIYTSLDKVFSPITLNRNDDEIVDVLSLELNNNQTDSELTTAPNIKTYSPGVFLLQKNEDYYIKVTVYASNTTSKPFLFKVSWDGTSQGFYNAFSKIKEFPIERPVELQYI
jgi:hypothetical protein